MGSSLRFAGKREGRSQDMHLDGLHLGVEAARVREYHHDGIPGFEASSILESLERTLHRSTGIVLAGGHDPGLDPAKQTHPAGQ